MKNHAVELREQMQYEDSTKIFERVLDWDEANENYRGYADVCGHQSILYRKWADRANVPEEKQDLRNRALEYCKKGLKILDDHPEALARSQSPKSNLYVHLSMIYFDTALDDSDNRTKFDLLKQALDAIKEAESLHSGTRASKGWLLKDKAKIVFELGMAEGNQQVLDSAWELLSQALTIINAESKEEIERDDQSKLKLSAWVGGVLLTFAHFHFRLGNHYMTELYCRMVLNSPDMSEIRKKESQKMVDQLN